MNLYRIRISDYSYGWVVVLFEIIRMRSLRPVLGVRRQAVGVLEIKCFVEVIIAKESVLQMSEFLIKQGL